MVNEFYNIILVEAVARTFHGIQQKEAQRQGNESPIAYNDLSEDNKEYIRVLSRFVLERLDKMVDVLEFYANEANWNTIMQDKDNMTLKDGIVFDDMGKMAREELLNLGINNNSGDK